jgi:hypothetical protein
MQITLNRIPFDVRPVEDGLRRALLSDPVIRQGLSRAVWSWDAEARKGHFTVPVTPQKGVPLPSGLMAWVARPGTNGAGPAKAEAPTRRMAERFLAALGAKGFQDVMQALTRVIGLPQRTVPFEAFAALGQDAPYTIRMESDLAVIELAAPSRNLSVYLFLPGLVAFAHDWTGEAPEGRPAAGSIRPGFIIPPPTQAAQAMRRLALAQRLQEVQAGLGGVKPADLPADDPRRALVARLGAEWRALQPQPTSPTRAA